MICQYNVVAALSSGTKNNLDSQFVVANVAVASVLRPVVVVVSVRLEQC